MTNISVPGVVTVAEGKMRQWLQRGGGDGAAVPLPAQSKPGAPASRGLPSGKEHRGGWALNCIKQNHEAVCWSFLFQQLHLAMLSDTCLQSVSLCSLLCVGGAHCSPSFPWGSCKCRGHGFARKTQASLLVALVPLACPPALAAMALLASEVKRREQDPARDPLPLL